MTQDQKCNQCGGTAKELRNGICDVCAELGTLALPTTPPIVTDRTIAPGQSAPFSAAQPKQFGEYELIEEIARGGMGVVYKARHQKLNRIAALKMILGGRFSSEEELQRFHVEAEAAARLDHAGIVPIYEIGEHDGQAFFAMKFIEGGSLAQHIERFHANPREAVKLLIKVARAVHHAHQRGILHRDLKPPNILMDEYDQPLITDLGLAKKTSGGSDLTHTGAVLGTPSYMPPEQAAGNQAVTTAADIYSLGAIMYELLTGGPPYKGASAVDTVMKVLQGSPPEPGKINANVDRDLELICMKCMEREPDARYSSAADFANDLENWLADEPISVKRPSMFSLAARWFRRNSKLVYFLFVVIIGFTVSIPIVLGLMTGATEMDTVYDHFSEDQRPLFFALHPHPIITAISAIFSILILWPMLGLLITYVTRPKNIRGALAAGITTSLLCCCVFYGLMGWLVIVFGSIQESDTKIRQLARAVWQPEGVDKEAALKKANNMFGGLQHIPEAERADIVGNRILADQFAQGPQSLGSVVLVCLVLCIPVVIGTVIAHILVQRKVHFVLIVMRYVFAWWASAIAGGMVMTYIFDGKFNNASARSQPIQMSLVFAGSLFVIWLSMKRWKKDKPKAEPEAKTNAAAVETQLNQRND